MKITKIILETIDKYVSLMLEEEERGSKTIVDDIQMAIPSTLEDVVSHFSQKLSKLKAKVASAGATITIDTQTYAPAKGELPSCIRFPFPTWVTDEMGNDGTSWKYSNFNGRDEYVIFTISINTPEAKLDGYTYIGSVVPMKLFINGQDVEEMMATVSNEFKGDESIMNAVKASTSKMRCDGCGTNRERGIYHCFLDPNGNVKKFGSNCAAKAFGIDISQNISMIFDGLYSIFSPIGRNGGVYDEFGEYIGQSSSITSLLSIISKNQYEENDFWDYMNRGCTAVLLYGPNCKMKVSMNDAIRYEELMKRIKADCTNKYGQLLYGKYCAKVSEAKAKYPQMFETRKKSQEMAEQFLSNGMEFFYTMEPQNDFEEKVRNIGLFITGAKIYKKTIGKFRNYNNFVPYCVQKYFQHVAAQNPESNTIKEKPIEPFTGEKTLTVTIESMDERMTRNGKPYHVVMGKTPNGEIVKWNMWQDKKMDIKRGDTIKISAIYSDRWNTLEDVKWLDKPVAQEPQQAVHQEPQYPEDRFRYSTQPFTIVKIQKHFEWFVVKNVNDGCEYYVDNIGGGFAYNDSPYYKYNLDGLTQNSTINIAATVSSYHKRDGSTGHKLLRIKGLEKDGTRVDSYDDYGY